MKIKSILLSVIVTIAASALLVGCVHVDPQAAGTRVKIDMQKGTAEWYSDKDIQAGGIHASYDPVTRLASLDITNINSVLNPVNAKSQADSNIELLKEAHAMQNDAIKGVGGAVTDAIGAGVKAAK